MYYMYAGIMNGNGNDNGDKMAALCFFSVLFCSFLFCFHIVFVVVSFLWGIYINTLNV